MATTRKIEAGGDVEAGDVRDDVTQDVKQYSAEDVVAEFFRPSDEDAEGVTDFADEVAPTSNDVEDDAAEDDAAEKTMELTFIKEGESVRVTSHAF